MVIGDREPRNSGREGGAAAIVAVCVPVVVMLGLGLWGLDRDGMWRDEGVTFQVARRSVGVPVGVGHRAAAVRAAVGDALRP
ncbi:MULTISPECIES: hypothetical protein [unclassified Streptomyces]|uniref:Uncharacterized protein n=1 Tax=Streptomyces sp. NBC_00180 TaxID=2903632 RepID=A0AAU1I1R1_9ACTN|nr:hypothetical protein OG331_29820 [Streptomyces sp. NBC_01017]